VPTPLFEERQEVGVEGVAGGFLRTFLLVHAVEALGDAGIAAGEAGDLLDLVSEFGITIGNVALP
jgi:hypothetical protein